MAIREAASEAVRLRSVFRRYVLLHSVATAVLTVCILFGVVFVTGGDDRSLAKRVDANAEITREHIEQIHRELREHDLYMECLLTVEPPSRGPADFAACRVRSRK